MKKLILLYSFLFCASMVFSQEDELDKIFAWKTVLSASQAAQGSTVFVDLTLAVQSDYFTYYDKTSFSVEAAEGIQAGQPLLPKAEEKKDPTDGEIKKVYMGTVNYRIPLSIAASAPLGKSTLKVKVKYQGCSQNLCYFPQTRTFPLELEVIAGSGGNTATSTPANATIAPKPKSEVEAWLARGYLAALVLVFFAGFLTSFTPCVYPLIPITITIFGARDTKSKWKGFTLAAVYVLGMAVMYSTLGFTAARTGAVFGQIMSNPWIIGGIAALFAVMGASMLGAFDIQLPSSWQTRLSTVSGKGYGSAFLMGLVGGVIAAPCTGPVLAALLAYVATTGNPWFGILLLFTFSLGLGVIFLIIGTFSGMISHLPKSGRWMESVKSVFGIMLFVFALYFLKDVARFLRTPLSFTVLTYVSAAIMLIFGIALGGIHLSYHTPQISQRIRKTVGVFLCVVSLYLGIGSLTAVKAADVNWIHDLKQGLALAQSEKKPVMIDFYADWCVACKELDAFTFSQPEVSQTLQKFVTIKIDLTESNEANQKIQQEYQISGLPLVVFIDSQGNPLTGKRITGFMEAKEFLKRIADIH